MNFSARVVTGLMLPPIIAFVLAILWSMARDSGLPAADLHFVTSVLLSLAAAIVLVRRQMAEKTAASIAFIVSMLLWSVLSVAIFTHPHIFQPTPCKSYQSRAKNMLKAVYVAELAYNGEFGTYLSLADLTGFGGLEPRWAIDPYYRLDIRPSTSTFKATAVDGVKPISTRAHEDRWFVDDMHAQPDVESNRCSDTRDR